MLFDEPELLTRTGDDRDFARELIELFVQTAHESLDQLKKSLLQDKDADATRKLAHSIKGSAASAAARKLSACAAALEVAAATPDAPKALQELMSCFESTVAVWSQSGWISRPTTEQRLAKPAA